MVLASIVMPVYNAQTHLKSALGSVLRQRGDFEIVAIDDCSTDGSLSILSQLRDPRIRVIHNESNQGRNAISAVYNRGFSEAKGDFVAVLDQDDELEGERSLEARTEFFASHPQAVCVFGAHRRIDEKGGVFALRRYQLETGIIDNESFMRRIRWHLFFPFAHSTVMYRKSLIDNIKYNPECHSGEGEFMFKIAQLGLQIGYVAEPVSRYRITANSESSSPKTGNFKHRKAFIDQIAPWDENHLLNLVLHGYRLAVDAAKDAYRIPFGRI